ncbi:MAG: DUF2782 domain-containing protein [Gammaproteobacteria bacterium]|nr:DUF2782 domain-containing protein [Gammaproteobacteria bacterium]MCW8839464.1 DUF2782 domain-containing protein [Gammaproteobacteria bacterium]MCW8972360.1 DUF2782 domain-containing protein [Gammaproteobacteria bacterium]MCW8992610.1 DUF2782 domain-containing protein [Gammaproteobacteria bacterium]MCW9089146.1 DUF2782 domain-containing protein [Gammaproteobacteria bacterium]
MRHLLTLFAALLLNAAVLAQEVAPPPPPLPESGTVPGASDEELQPEVTIIRRGKDVIEEYRVSGQLYMIKITPGKGRPYYLVDTDGDGSLETRRNDLDSPEVIKWRIFTW